MSRIANLGFKGEEANFKEKTIKRLNFLRLIICLNLLTLFLAEIVVILMLTLFTPVYCAMKYFVCIKNILT